jgi:RHS repeat-associated protein
VFDYDVAGSIVASLEVLGGASEPKRSEVAPGNVLVRSGNTKYTYDARGRRTRKVVLDAPGGPQATEYTWDTRDCLRAVTLADGTRLRYTYDALGRRIRKDAIAKDSARTAWVEWLWDDQVLAAEVDSEGHVRTFVHEPGTFFPLLQQESGEVFTYVNDHLGMPKELLARDGVVAWSGAHSAFGKVVASHADLTANGRYARPIGTPFRLLGQVADDEAELTWTRYRCFDASVGRWLSADPLGFDGGPNLFAFDGSPTLVVDPLGLATTGGKHSKKKPEQGRAGKKLADEGGVTVQSHGTSDVDRPAHAHVSSPGQKDCRIGPNGKPIDGQRELTPQEKTVVANNLPAIRKELKKVGRASSRMEAEGNLPGANNTSKKEE